MLGQSANAAGSEHDDGARGSQSSVSPGTAWITYTAAPADPLSYTWRSAVVAFLGILVMIVVAVVLAVLLSDVLDPLPYNDPEPPPVSS